MRGRAWIVGGQAPSHGSLPGRGGQAREGEGEGERRPGKAEGGAPADGGLPGVSRRRGPHHHPGRPRLGFSPAGA